jgi:hyaluronoglucosaminidase
VVAISGASGKQQAIIESFFKRHESAFKKLDTVIEVSKSNAMTRESFDINASLSGSKLNIKIAATDLHSVRWALNAVRKWLKTGAKEPLAITDKPDFRWRGVVEGFYGNPWTAEQRLKGVEYFGDFGMNLYLIAPKDAQWQRFQWRNPLSDDFLKELAELIARGNENAVDVAACVSPGLSVTYSSDEDVQAVVNKFLQTASVGAWHFGLLLDDIPDVLTHENDLAKYGNVAQAHADFANRVRTKLVEANPLAHVILCPMHYAGRGTEPYCHVMGDELHPQIDLMWTGREICSGYLDIADAVVFNRSTRRPPFYWDNYPVNDGSMANRLHIGPIEGREKGLHKYSAGLLANPMEHFEASLISLGTIGDYLWSTENYSAYESWEEILVDLIPTEEDRKAIQEFFRNTLGLTGHWSPEFNQTIGACSSAWRDGNPEKAAQAAREAAKKIRQNHKVISSDGFCAPLLRNEIAPWLDKYALGAEWLEGMASVLDECVSVPGEGLHGPKSGHAKLIQYRAELNATTRKLFGDGFDIMLGELAGEITFDRD